MSLFGGNALRIATLTDYHNGDKNKIERLKGSGLLSINHIFLACDYTSCQTSDIEDIIGSKAYIKLVNACYGLSGDSELSADDVMEGEVLHTVEKLLSPDPQIHFDHYRPSMYLMQHPDVWSEEDISLALDRFERLCSDINAVL